MIYTIEMIQRVKFLYQWKLNERGKQCIHPPPFQQRAI